MMFLLTSDGVHDLTLWNCLSTRQEGSTFPTPPSYMYEGQCESILLGRAGHSVTWLSQDNNSF